MTSQRIRDRVELRVDGHIAHVVLDRPDKRNALDGEMFAAIAAAGAALVDRGDVHAVVLSGNGASFCAGLDLALFAAMQPDGGFAGGADTDPGAITDSGLTHLAQQICWVWQEIPVPVIAALHGHAIGGGFQLALGADVRIAHPDTKLSAREVHWGLIPDMTGTFVLSRLVRPDVALELIASARIFDAAEGERLGVVTRLADDPLAAAVALAEQFAANSPEAVRAAKALVGRIVNDGVGDHLAAERDAIWRLIGSANQAEAVLAAAENRPPEFSDPR